MAGLDSLSGEPKRPVVLLKPSEGMLLLSPMELVLNFSELMLRCDDAC